MQELLNIRLTELMMALQGYIHDFIVFYFHSTNFTGPSLLLFFFPFFSDRYKHLLLGHPHRIKLISSNNSVITGFPYLHPTDTRGFGHFRPPEELGLFFSFGDHAAFTHHVLAVFQDNYSVLVVSGTPAGATDKSEFGLNTLKFQLFSYKLLFYEVFDFGEACFLVHGVGEDQVL
jgi:hypothetical protein